MHFFMICISHADVSYKMKIVNDKHSVLSLLSVWMVIFVGITVWSFQLAEYTPFVDITRFTLCIHLLNQKFDEIIQRNSFFSYAPIRILTQLFQMRHSWKLIFSHFISYPCDWVTHKFDYSKGTSCEAIFGTRLFF